MLRGCSIPTRCPAVYHPMPLTLSRCAPRCSGQYLSRRTCASEKTRPSCAGSSVRASARCTRRRSSARTATAPLSAKFVAPRRLGPVPSGLARRHESRDMPPLLPRARAVGRVPARRAGSSRCSLERAACIAGMHRPNEGKYRKTQAARKETRALGAT